MVVSVINVVDLRKSYRTYRKAEGLGGALRALIHRVPVEVPAVAGISFSVEPGEMVGFLGPNGAGKTTTLKILSGLLHPSGGSVRVLDHAPYRRDAAFLRQIALVTGQKSQLWWDLPPMDTFVLNREIYDVPDPQFRATLTELVDLLGIGEEMHRPVRQLSLGQRMRCELVAALLHRPRVLFLDEPTIGLDIVVQKRIRDFFLHYNRRYETTVLLTSHYMDDVETLCPRVMVINQGNLVFDGAVTDLIERHAATKYVGIVFTSPVPRQELETFGKVIAYEDGLSATLAIPRAVHSRQAAALLNRYQIDDLDVRDPGLEDIIGGLFESPTTAGAS
jgi:ABC-2 type transport system ATP-binding protein